MASALTLAALLCAASVLPAAAAGQSRWYLAEGATGDFDTEILIANPHDQPVDVKITWVLPILTPPVAPTTFTMPPTSRKTVRVKDIPGLASTAVSAIVESTNTPALDIVVERSMYWRDQGLPKGHNSPGILTPATRWYLAEGATGDFRNFVLLANPDATRTAEVDLTFLRDDGTTVGPIRRTVGPGQRETVFVNVEVPPLAVASFSTHAEAVNGVPILVERSMYFPSTSAQFPGPVGHESGGVPDLSTRWLFGEGVTGGVPPNPIFDTFLLLANPAATAATVQVVYAKEGGQRYEQTLTLDPTSRTTIWVNYQIPGFAAAAFSMEVVSDIPILAERAVYWGGGTPATWREAHNSPGATDEATAWAFAEGLDGGFDLSGILYQSYFLVGNTSPTLPLELKVTFLREDGTGFVKEYKGSAAIVPGSRFTFASWQFPELSNQRFATFIEATNGTPFVAERAVYWGIGFVGGHNSLGTPWSGPVATPPAVPDPALTSIAPNESVTAGGIGVTISGTNLAFPASVTIGGAPATNVLVWNATTITAVVPPNTAGPKDVVVTSRGIEKTLIGAFTYTTPPPVVTSLSISQGPTYGGTVVELTGQHFTSNMSVNFGGTAVTSFTWLNDTTRVRVVTPPRVAGGTFVQVSNQFGTSTTAANAFTYVKTTATNVILAFGDSITYGVSSTLNTTTQSVDIIFPTQPEPWSYPSRLQARLASTYPVQSIGVTNAGLPCEGVTVNPCGPTTGTTRLPATLRAAQDLVIILEGVNDANADGVSATSILLGLKSMARSARQAGKYVIVSSLTPMKPHVITGEWPADAAKVAAVSNNVATIVAELNAEPNLGGGVYFFDMFNQLPIGAISPDGLHPSIGGYDQMAQLLHNFIQANFELVPPPVP